MTRVLNSGPSVYVGESRSELLTWVNDLLQLNVTKIEQMGTGSIYCQVFDSIYGDVPMNKVKFDTNQEYEYVANFKILQSCFTSHKIDKYIPVEKLIKLKFQDNIEFMQWVKKFWDANFQNPEYDALGRRKGAGMKASTGAVVSGGTPVRGGKSLANAGRTRSTTSNSKENISNNTLVKSSSSSNGVAGGAVVKKAASVTSSGAGAVKASSINNELIAENEQLRATIGTLENIKRNAEEERQFYYRKLRRIEMLLQDHEEDVAGNPLLKSVEEILFSTEDPEIVEAAIEPTY